MAENKIMHHLRGALSDQIYGRAPIMDALTDIKANNEKAFYNRGEQNMKDKYFIDTKNGAGVTLRKDGCGVTIFSCGENGGEHSNMCYHPDALRILAKELVIAADKLEAGTLFDDEFDWKDVRPGMCFTDGDDKCWYVCKSFYDDTIRMFTNYSDCSGRTSGLDTDDLIRYPEGDADCVKGAV